MRRTAVLLCAALSSTSLSAYGEPQGTAPLQFQIQEGRITNAFYQQGPMAAHLLLTDGLEPRVLVAFPAGNSGVGVWFERTDKPVHWKLETISGETRADDRGRPLHGIIAKTSIDAQLVIRDAVLSSVRVLRDYQLAATYPPDVRSTPKRSSNTIEWSRSRLDGAAGYELSLKIENGEISGNDPVLRLTPSHAGEPMRLTITAMSGEPSLTPIGSARLLNSNASDDPRSQQVLSFLSYKEKFLAGSWRFDTYFGRDTLMSLRLLMPVLQPDAIESGIASVLFRLAPDGEVAHEEDIGEFAVLRHRHEEQPANDAPIYDYKMIDDDFMLAPLAAAYLLDHPAGRNRASAFLASKLANGETVGAALARNFKYVTETATAFAQAPRASNLLSLKPGINVGDWRDSEDGLGGGRYPYDVNAVLVPAALEAIGRLSSGELLKPYFPREQVARLEHATHMADVWRREAPTLFRVTVSNADARRQIATYAGSIGVDAKGALHALGTDDVTANALSLDAQYRPIPILNSDGGFALLLQDRSSAEVEQIVDTMMRPFPAGLLTDAGLLVANPVFADADRKRVFSRNAYHGTVTWSWQQALLAAGLERQISRRDLPSALIERLRSAQTHLWQVIDATRTMRSSELWSWRFADGHYEAVPFGQSGSDADESNAAQLWSTVYLAVTPPKGP
ncbi:MAG TPA: hypothetical protein VFS24_04385 [Steroidobacteraceae bacterium]|nr:hypothetical protein [Steroidobacteraceae bacterium]